MTASTKTPSQIIAEFLGQNGQYLRSSEEPDRVFAKSKKVEVIYIIVSKGIPLLRTEGAGDVTLLDVNARNSIIAVPAILPEKVQAKLRRRILEILRGNFNNKVKDRVKSYKELGFVKLGEDGSWNCYVAPPKEAEEADIGMCGFCPACNILGAIITRSENPNASTSYGLKSRIVHDIAFGTVRYEKAVVDLTHNKVGDGVSYTGRSLYEESHVLPGVMFVGKLAMYDVTEMEAKLVLSALASISRMGGGETKYGSVQVIVVGLKAGDRETISSYDVARRLLEKYGGEPVPPETIVKDVAEYVDTKGFTVVIDGSKKMDELDTAVALTEDDIVKLWDKDNYTYASNVVEYILRAEGRQRESRKREQFEDEGEKGRKRKRKEESE